jgi:hypothetical protein
MVCCCYCIVCAVADYLRYAAKLDDILPPCVLTDDDLSDSEDYDGKHNVNISCAIYMIWIPTLKQ